MMWEDASDNALDLIYSMRAPTDASLHTLRSLLDDFIVRTYGADEESRGKPEAWWTKLGATAVAVAGNDYAEARKYLTRYDIHALLIKKQRDYGHDNIQRFGCDGLLVRVHDKVARLENLLSSNAFPQNEPVIDTFADIIGYSAIGIMLEMDTFMLPLSEI
jgi:hypothetical protein